jgi:hypothetical protein
MTVGRNRFVSAETTRLELSDSDWVEVKSRLSYGEQQRLAEAAFGDVSMADAQSGNLHIKYTNAEFNLTRLATWLVDWSFVDAKGKTVKISRATIAALDPETVAEIDSALTAHLERQSEKKAETNGEPVPETS